MPAPDNRHIVDVIYVHLHIAALPRYKHILCLQIHQCRYFITVLRLFIRYKTELNARQSTHCCAFSSL